MATGVVDAALVAATTISIVFAVEAGRQRIVAEERAAQIEEKTAEVQKQADEMKVMLDFQTCLLYTSPSPRDKRQSRMPSSA